MTNTSIQWVGERFYVKRDDECVFKFASLSDAIGGTRARMALAIMQRGFDEACFTRFVIAGSRQSPDLEMIGWICKAYDVTLECFMPTGVETPTIKYLTNLGNVTIHRVENGYNNVLIARARDYVGDNPDLCLLPFMFQCRTAIESVMPQLSAIPNDAKRIIAYDESGILVLAIIMGLEYYGKHNIEVLGVTSAKEPYGIMSRYLGRWLFDRPQITWSYRRVEKQHKEGSMDFHGISLDLATDAQCVRFLDTNDMLWVSGNRIEK